MCIVLLKTVSGPWYKNELQQYQYNVRKNTKNYSDFVLNFFRASSTIFKVDRGHQWKSNKLLSVLVWCCCKSTLNSKSVAQNWHLTRLPGNLLNYCTFFKKIQGYKCCKYYYDESSSLTKLMPVQINWVHFTNKLNIRHILGMGPLLCRHGP